jgi:glycosyltransferase involved in cell wall biosynthesis
MEYTKYTNIKDELTIVIPCFNEVNYIGKTLTSIKKQIGIGGTRVIICDNESTDGTVGEISFYIDKFRKDLNIEIHKGGRVARARNIGANLSTTPFILFLDADSILTNKNQIKDALTEIKTNNLNLVTCKVKSISPSIKSRIAFKLFNLVNNIISKKTPFAVGTFFLTTKSSFFYHGQFDETLQHSEDYCLSKKYKPSEFRIINHYIGQDDRRFKKMGYTGMIKLLMKSFRNRNNINFFRNDVGYWD